MSIDKFNSTSGFEFDIDNIISKIRLDFDTNVIDPTNYLLGVDETQSKFILVSPNSLQSTNSYITNMDLKIRSNDIVGSVNNYVFGKMINPSTVGCSNCDSTTDIQSAFIDTGKIPNINKEVIGEFEISPNASHTFEIDLIGHRKICDETGNCYDSWYDGDPVTHKDLVIQVYPTTWVTG